MYLLAVSLQMAAPQAKKAVIVNRMFSAWWLLLVPFSSLAQNGPHIRSWRPPQDETSAAPKTACSNLRALTGYEFSIVSAVAMPATANAPEFCRVLGQVQPEIRFEVALPVAWNRRLYMFGNGGYAGESIEAPARQQRRDQALRLGFAVTQTNTGHDAAEEPLGSFAVNSQKLIDYAFRSLHVTAMTAKRVAAEFYGGAPRRSYFDGCSTGGRQALILAQRFPQDFDGIISGMPVLNFTGTMLRYVATARALQQSPIPLGKLKLLAGRIYEHCDEKDGLKDGLLDDPRRCGFEPSKHLPVCQGAEGADCFTPGQIKALEVVYNDVYANGRRVFPGWPVGPEIAAGGRAGWENWFIREQDRPTNIVYSETFFRYLAFPRKAPDYNIAQFDFERDVPRLDGISRMLDATDPDLTAFRDRGGKLLMYFGWADPALNPRMGVEYYEDVLKKVGASTGDFFKLYMMPGVFHCGGGVGPGSFDPLEPLIGWVEQSKAPSSLTAAQMEGGKAVRTRPLCPYPQVARYKGSGSPAEAANFTCASPAF